MVYVQVLVGEELESNLKPSQIISCVFVYRAFIIRGVIFKELHPPNLFLILFLRANFRKWFFEQIYTPVQFSPTKLYIWQKAFMIVLEFSNISYDLIKTWIRDFWTLSGASTFSLKIRTIRLRWTTAYHTGSNLNHPFKSWRSSKSLNSDPGPLILTLDE